jgi:hypothetical protein
MTAKASLKDKKYGDLKFKWEPETIMFADGTVLGKQPKNGSSEKPVGEARFGQIPKCMI